MRVVALVGCELVDEETSSQATVEKCWDGGSGSCRTSEGPSPLDLEDFT